MNKHPYRSEIYQGVIDGDEIPVMAPNGEKCCRCGCKLSEKDFPAKIGTVSKQINYYRICWVWVCGSCLDLVQAIIEGAES